jgi:hypothetical protein
MPTPNTQVQKVTAAILEASGQQSVSEIDAGAAGTILRAQNAAIQELCGKAPASWWGADEFGALVKAPKSGTATFTQGLKTITDPDPGDIAGQALFAGDETGVANRVISRAGALEAMFAYQGESGTLPIAVYYDTLELPQDFRRFKSSLTLMGSGNIPVTEDAFDNQFTTARATPTAARVISRENDSGERVAFLRFNAMPTAAIRVYGEYYRRPANIATLDDERNDICPAGYLESVFIPVAIMRYISLGGSAIDPASIQAAYAQVGTILTEATAAPGFVMRKTRSGYFS